MSPKEQVLPIAQEERGSAVVVALPSPVEMFERLAKDPQVDVEKLERLIAMQERIMRHNAKAAFDAAFARMQSDIPEVDERGQILVKGVLRSTYATLEDIHAAVKPVLQKHGFAIRHRTEWPDDKANVIRIVGILSHEQGHSEESVFQAPMDRSEFRTDIQSMGSTVKYGRRYTTLDLLNIATRKADDDGRAAGQPQPPNGLRDWWDDMQATADGGWGALQAVFAASKPEFKEFVMNHMRGDWSNLKAKAQKVKVTR